MTTMTDNTIEVDGSQGEGGGQILRTSLALSIVTGRALHMRQIRARRRKPGLMRQHLTAVRAAAEICGATVSGDELRSSAIMFRPGPACPGDYTFSVGTAGSITLVLQTVLWPLLLADGPSTIKLEGGTHNPMAPPFEFLDQSLLPCVQRMGGHVSLVLERAGFYPAGGGIMHAKVRGSAALRPLHLLTRGELANHSATAQLSNLPSHIGNRELAAVCERLSWPRRLGYVEELSSVGPGNVLRIDAEHEGGRSMFIGFGEKGVSAERVAAGVCSAFERWHEANVPVDEHLADQLLIPMALARGGSFRTTALTRHAQSNADLIERWLPVSIERIDEGGGVCRVEVHPRQ